MNPVFNALNKRLLIFGIDRMAFAVSLGVSVLIFWAWSPIPAVSVFIALFSISKWATKEDERFPRILLAISKLPESYDSAYRQ